MHIFRSSPLTRTALAIAAVPLLAAALGACSSSSTSSDSTTAAAATSAAASPASGKAAEAAYDAAVLPSMKALLDTGMSGACEPAGSNSPECTKLISDLIAGTTAMKTAATGVPVPEAYKAAHDAMVAKADVLIAELTTVQTAIAANDKAAMKAAYDKSSEAGSAFFQTITTLPATSELNKALTEAMSGPAPSASASISPTTTP